MAYPDCARKTEGKILNIKYHGKTTRYSQIQGKHRKFLDVQNTGRISGPRKKRYRTGPRVERSRVPANAGKPEFAQVAQSAKPKRQISQSEFNTLYTSGITGKKHSAYLVAMSAKERMIQPNLFI